VFRDADGATIESQATAPTAPSLPPLALEPMDIKADTTADMALLRDQIRVLQRNVTVLQERVNALR
jgi:hypothetical protein